MSQASHLQVGPHEAEGCCEHAKNPMTSTPQERVITCSSWLEHKQQPPGSTACIDASYNSSWLCMIVWLYSPFSGLLYLALTHDSASQACHW